MSTSTRKLTVPLAAAALVGAGAILAAPAAAQADSCPESAYAAAEPPAQAAEDTATAPAPVSGAPTPAPETDAPTPAAGGSPAGLPATGGSGRTALAGVLVGLGAAGGAAAFALARTARRADDLAEDMAYRARRALTDSEEAVL